MDLFIQLLIGIIPAVVSGFVAYYRARKNAEVELARMHSEAQREIKKIETESEKRINEIEKQSEERLKEIHVKREADLKYYKGVLEAEYEKKENEQIGEHANNFLEGFMSGDKGIDDMKKLKELEKQLDDLNKGLDSNS